ncbi:MAG TPA: FliM/FliN family flagellar motor switch protein [Candidatus Binataceae bacterium]|nr:FliM/FliN family flagellar motor switch protein [Candidatus Binataceae bacterium]
MKRDSLDPAVTVSAVISRLEMSAVELAALEPGDIVETEPQVGHEPMIRLTIGAATVALATIAKRDGKLIATIINNRPELSGRKGDIWKVKRANPTA